MQHTIDDLLAEVRAESTIVAGVGTLISGLRKQVADALAQSQTIAEANAKIEEAFNVASANHTALAAAVTENTATATAAASGTAAAPSGTVAAVGTDSGAAVLSTGSGGPAPGP